MKISIRVISLIVKNNKKNINMKYNVIKVMNIIIIYKKQNNINNYQNI